MDRVADGNRVDAACASDRRSASGRPNLPFFGNVTNNIMALVKALGDGGLVGLITLGVILWLFSGRKVA